MARTHDDAWDLASSVGATATMVAAARAMATRAEHPLITDPYAEPLVRAVGVDVLTRLASGDLAPEELGAIAGADMRRLAQGMAVRTVFFDQFFLAAAHSGITQAVILASGLDARAYRLAWPAATTVYEIDQPAVVDFKTRTLASIGAEPTARHHTVAIDLRSDWPTALKDAGFDPAQPTVWSAEGLLGYLPPAAQDQLLDTITALSALTSRLAIDSVPVPDASHEKPMRQRIQQMTQQWRGHGFDIDLNELVYFGDRTPVATYLADHGWQMNASSFDDLFVAHGLPPLGDEEAAGFGDTQYIGGTLLGRDAAR
ncbi:class I SAM-dependent methyltransferase [soil metagenome]